jgi:hypothetical protein
MLVVLFLSYYVSATSFYHTHYYSWGTVTHSHFYFPFGDNPMQHNHTQNQCLTIHLLSHFVLMFFIAATFFKTGLIRRVYCRIYRCESHRHLISSPLRAPPFV